MTNKGVNTMSKTYTILQKASGTGTIHDIASEFCDREVVFAPGCKYAVVLASYYGGKGYTTHRTEEAAIKADQRVMTLSRTIIDTDGNTYTSNGVDLIAD